MANTKITTNVIADGAITSAKLDSSSLSIPSTATATTQSAGDNSTKVATTAYVETAVSNLVSAAPAALDTLDELAAALGDDANFSTTITNSLALKAPLASPDFTGDVTFDTSTLVVDSTNNRVGVGIASPSHPLHVSGASGATQAFFNTTSGNTNFQIKVTEDAGTVLISKDNTAARSLSFQIGESNVAMTIDTSGNIAVSGTVDGRDIASDGSKLDGIESGATADQTASEILTAIKTVDGSGSGLDADLLDGISSASFLRSDATDTASGDLTFTGFCTFDNDASPAVKIISDDFAEGLEIHRNHATLAPAIKFTNTTGQLGILFANSSGVLQWRDLETTNSYSIWHAGNDGSGSGLDADLLDGVQGSSYLRSDASDTFTTLSGTQLNLGSEVQLRESTDRPDLLQITSSTSTWAGLQVRNSNNEGRWSFMTDGTLAGIYDDENSKWHIQMDENGETRLYSNATERITATSVGADILGQLYVDSTTDAKFILQGSSDPYMVFKEGTTDKCHIGWDSVNTRIFFTAVEDNSGGGAQGNFIFKSGDLDDPLKIGLAASDSDIYGYVYAEHGNTIGFLDQDANWAIKHVHDSRTEFYDNNSLVFSIGQGANLGDYGSVATCDGGKGGWAGYSIEGRVVFMHDIDTNSWGIFNDVNNEWMILGDLNGTVGLRYDGVSRLETRSNGVYINNTLDIVSNIDDVVDIYLQDQLIHSGDTNNYFQFDAADGNRFVLNGQEQVKMRTGDTNNMMEVNNQSTSHGANVFMANSARSATGAYDFLESFSGFSDAEFRLRGDGQAYADGSWNGGGADYAEFFESTDGTAIPLGTTVVLDEGKVRAATADDDVSQIIGVVRPKGEGNNSCVIGNAAWNYWNDKYLRDDFGQYIYDEHQVVSWVVTGEENGRETREPHSYEDWNIPEDVVIPDDAVYEEFDVNGNRFKHKRLNPNFDETQTYLPRDERDEWNVIGLVGQVRILVNQPKPSNWIKLRDISDNVEEWFIK
jgi:hypothetical protein